MKIEAITLDVFLSPGSIENLPPCLKMQCRGSDYNGHTQILKVGLNESPEILASEIQNSLNEMRFSKPVGEIIFHNEGTHKDEQGIPTGLYNDIINYLRAKQYSSSLYSSSPQILKISFPVIPNIYSK